MSAEDDLGRVGKLSARRMQLSNGVFSGYKEFFLCFTRVWLTSSHFIMRMVPVSGAARKVWMVWRLEKCVEAGSTTRQRFHNTCIGHSNPHSFVWFSALLSTAGLGSALVPASSMLGAAKPTHQQGKLGPESSCKPLSPAGCRRRRPRTSGRGVGRRGPGPAPPAAATSERCRASRTGTPPSRPAPTQSPPSETNEQADRQNTESF